MAAADFNKHWRDCFTKILEIEDDALRREKLNWCCDAILNADGHTTLRFDISADHPRFEEACAIFSQRGCRAYLVEKKPDVSMSMPGQAPAVPSAPRAV